ncbi:MAG: lytic transglycosylase F [Desulfobacteraceae bacterium]|nr:lytic transglycosylase F [Desulfobacteraceae bacterium]
MKRVQVILGLCLVLAAWACPASALEGTAAAPAASADAQNPPQNGDHYSDAFLDAIKSYRCTGDLDELAKFKVIRVLTVYSKTFYFLDGAEQRGITYEFMKDFERFLNAKLKTEKRPYQVIFIPVRRDELLPFLLEGRGDIAAGNLTITPERREKAVFSDPINKFDDISEVIVTGPSAPALVNIEDLAGREVYVRASSSYFESLKELNERLRNAGKAEVVIKAADENLETEDILDMVNAGLVGITVVDSHIASFWAGVFDHIKVHSHLALKTGDKVGWAFRKGSPRLTAIANEFIQQHGHGSALMSTLFKRYLRENKWVKNSTAGEERKRFFDSVKFFRKYGSQYNLDYLLIAAQAYQESGLDQKVRSPSGAVGVMQIKPETAAAFPVSIKNIHKLDNNIHAGVRYLRFFIDDFYARESMDPMDKIIFAFASYNAGPGRIASLREKAAKQGLDPNSWFNNVERVVARSIGNETVQYVRNIYKYYLAYQMLQQREEMKKAAITREKRS